MRTVIVTGASRGIGAAVARRLRVEGVRVVGVARSANLLEAMRMEKLGSGPFEYVVGDVTDQSVINSAVQLAASAGHQLVGIVLNAAVLEPIQRVADLDLDAVRKHFEVNIFSQIALVKAALPDLHRAPNGRIVFVTSGVVDFPSAGWSPYAMSKSAMNAFIAALAREQPEVYSVAIKPGLVDTQMLHESQNEAHRAVMDDTFKTWFKEAREKNMIVQPEVPGSVIAKAVLSLPRSLSGLYLAYSDDRLAGL
jgi:NAD(P)-dependent dehydrogenase (short-subunit alcohol dehydrogenase family)